MPFTIEMTGAQDYQRLIKFALAGYPGAGKTLFSSTAPAPFYVFFREQPRIMSIAERYMPHTKVTNQYDSSGRITVPVWETFLEVMDYLSDNDVYKTVVIDTGDELFQAMKEGKKAQNRGKWAIQDWGWIADMYREVINRVIDLEKHVIVTYHLKQTQEGDDGQMFRELALQGAAKDEAAGWFDLVGVIDSWEDKSPEGDVSTRRGILFETTTRYPFVKDHSGKLGKVFELSSDFVGDFGRMDDAIYAQVPTVDHEVIETITVAKKEAPPVEKTSAETGVPTPADLKAKKEAAKKPAAKKPAAKKPAAKKAPAKKPAAKKPAAKKKEEAVEETEPVATEAASPADETTAGAEGPASAPVPESVEEREDQGTEQADSSSEVPDEEGDGEAPVTPTEALENVEEAFEDATVEFATCDKELEDGTVCGVPLTKSKTNASGEPLATSDGELIEIPDRDLMDLTMIRFRKHMCREHFTQARKG